MKIKQMIFILAAIICAFVISGYQSVKKAQTGFSSAIVQSHSATQDIGLSFDWYALVLVDTTVKYTHGIIDSKEALKDLKTGHSKNKELLQQYFNGTILPEEVEYSKYIASQDRIIDELLQKLYVYIKTDNKSEINKLLPQIYNVTEPLCAAINHIIDIKTQNAVKEKEGIVDSIDRIQRFLFMSFALCLALCIGMFIPDDE